MISTYLPKLYRGILLSISITLLAFILKPILGLSVVLLALLLGVLTGNIIKIPENYNPGIKKSSSTFLELAIVFIAFSIDYNKLIDLGWKTIFIITSTMTLVLAATILLVKKMKDAPSSSYLIGFGTAICGSSAIAALSSVIPHKKEDLGISLAVVNFYGLLGMIFLPFVLVYFYNEYQSGIFLGASLHSVGNVAGAGFGMNNIIGELAITVKLGRVALLTPALLIFQIFIEKSPHTKQSTFKIPWYLLIFIFISTLTSFIDFPENIIRFAGKISAFLLAVAMAAIGLKINFKNLLTSGKKGLIFGGIVFITQLLAIIFLLKII